MTVAHAMNQAAREGWPTILTNRRECGAGQVLGAGVGSNDASGSRRELVYQPVHP